MVIKDIESNSNLPYYHNYCCKEKNIGSDNNDNNHLHIANNNIYKKRQISKSYGIICVTRDNYIVLNKSPPYIKSYMKKVVKNFSKTNFGKIKVNTNEKYNLLLSAFPNSTLEGEYTLPKGRIDDMDKKNSIFTKVREFIEETKVTHPLFSQLLNKHYQDSSFKSFLNDENFILRERWLGLDNKIYNCEYSVFIINSIKELIFVNDVNSNTVPFSYFLDSFNVYRDCGIYYKKYKQSSSLDRQKQTLFLPIEIGFNLLNQHKIRINDEKKSIIQADDIYRIIHSYNL